MLIKNNAVSFREMNKRGTPAWADGVRDSGWSLGKGDTHV